MRAIFSTLLSFQLCLIAVDAASNTKANELAAAVFKASGGENWSKVRSIQFTFNVAKDGENVLSAKHQWNVRNGTDTVAWDGKAVTVNLQNPGKDTDAKAAYHRWVNDSYWLLAPLKLRNPGVTLEYKGKQELEGKTLHVLSSRYDSVGLTPQDQYNFYIDPASNLVVYWDYMPNPSKKVSGSWEDYQDFSGLKLSTDRQFGGRHIWFSDVKVETDSE